MGSTDIFRELLQKTREASIIALDTETTGLNPRKDRIIGWSVSLEEGSGYYFPLEEWKRGALSPVNLSHYCSKEVSTVFFKELVGKKLVFHNAAFDVEFIRNYLGVDLLDSVWVDTQVLVHTLSEEGVPNTKSPFSLKTLAVYHQNDLGLEDIGNIEQLELAKNVKKNGGDTKGANFEIWKADLEVLYPYACADTDLTLRLCNFYLRKLKEEGLEKLFFEIEVMPLYREVTVPMMRNGIKLDLELLNQTKQEITIDIDLARREVLEELYKDTFARRWIMITARREFPVDSSGPFAQRLCLRYNLNLLELSPKRYSLSKKNLDKCQNLLKFERESDKVAIVKFLKTADRTLLDRRVVNEIILDLWKEKNNGYLININSKNQLSEIVFDYMKIKGEGEKLKSGRNQFNEEFILKLAKKYVWAKKLWVYNKLLKIRSTYVDRFLEVHEGGYFYPLFKQHGTISGRYASDMQQLPRPIDSGDDIVSKYNNRIRAFFVAGKDRKIIDADYESLEPHCFAFVSGDQGIIDIFNKGWDFYSTIAIDTEKLKGYSKHKSATNYLGKKNKAIRTKAKIYALGIAYGMEAYALHKYMEVSKEKAWTILRGYFESYPKLKQWMDKSRAYVKKNGYVKNYLGRVRHLVDVKRFHKIYGDNLLSLKFRRDLEKVEGREKVTRIYNSYKRGINNSLNFQIQSLAAGIVNRAAIAINKRAKELDIDAYVQCQIHDQLVINCEEKKVHIFASEVQRLMEETVKLPGIKLKAPPEITNNFRDGH